jgi:hypothetical protein
MSKHTLPLYALTPITETEGLENGTYDLIYRRCSHRVIYPHTFQNGRWLDLPDEFEDAVYLRPLPEGTRPVPHDLLMEIKGTLTAIAQVSNCNGSRQLANGLLTKLAQMGDK